jgi:hypothetical protein
MNAILGLQHTNYIPLVDAIGKRYFRMSIQQLQELEGNIGQLIVAQAVMFLKANYNLREAIPRDSERDESPEGPIEAPMIEAFRRVRASRVNNPANAGEAAPAPRRRL